MKLMQVDIREESMLLKIIYNVLTKLKNVLLEVSHGDWHTVLHWVHRSLIYLAHTEHTSGDAEINKGMSTYVKSNKIN